MIELETPTAPIEKFFSKEFHSPSNGDQNLKGEDELVNISTITDESCPDIESEGECILSSSQNI